MDAEYNTKLLDMQNIHDSFGISWSVYETLTSVISFDTDEMITEQFGWFQGWKQKMGLHLEQFFFAMKVT